MKYLLLPALLVCLFFAGCNSSGKNKPGMYEDRIIGWYRLGEVIENPDINNKQKIVPIFKRSNEFYTICRGFEMPLRRSPVGLVWDFKPSSMEGTSFLFCGPSWPCNLKVYDSQLVGMDWYEPGKKYRLTKIPDPECLSDIKEEKPVGIDDFVGEYTPIYFPYYKIIISKKEDVFLHQYSQVGVISGKPEWSAPSRPIKIEPLDENNGFLVVENRAKNYLMYSEQLERYEVIIGQTGLRCPLRKIEEDSGDFNLPEVEMGIPSWN